MTFCFIIYSPHYTIVQCYVVRNSTVSIFRSRNNEKPLPQCNKGLVLEMMELLNIVAANYVLCIRCMCMCFATCIFISAKTSPLLRCHVTQCVCVCVTIPFQRFQSVGIHCITWAIFYVIEVSSGVHRSLTY